MIMSTISFTAFYTQELRAMIAQLSHKALRMYVLIATYADKRGVCWPGLKELSERANMRIESVIDGLRELEILALIGYARRNERDPVTGQMRSNVYIVSGCLVRSADSGFDPASEHEPIPLFELKSNTTNEITNDNKQESTNQFQAPPPSNQAASTEKAAVGADDYATQEQKQPKKTKAKAKDKDSSAAGTAPQNSKAPLPPTPPLPPEFDANAELLDQDDEQAARRLCADAITRLDGGHYSAALSMANARRYVARYDRWRVRAAITLARRDPATKSIIGRMDYLLRTSVATEAQELQDEMNRLNDLDQAGD
jgi:hypothetical protein